MRITKSVQKLEAYVPGEQPKSPNVVKVCAVPSSATSDSL